MNNFICFLNNNINYNSNFFKDLFYNNNTYKLKNSFFQPSFSIKMMVGSHQMENLQVNSKTTIGIEEDNIYLLFSGNITNYKKLAEISGFQEENIESDDNTTINIRKQKLVIFLYKKYGIEQCIRNLQGNFSFILYDSRINKNDLTFRMYSVSGKFGVVPLYILKINNSYKNLHNHSLYTGFDNFIGISTDYNMLNEYLHKINEFSGSLFSLEQQPPATYSYYFLNSNALASWEISENTCNKSYYIPMKINIYDTFKINYNEELENIFNNTISSFFNDNKKNNFAFIIKNNVLSMVFASYLFFNYHSFVSFYAVEYEDTIVDNLHIKFFIEKTKINCDVIKCSNKKGNDEDFDDIFNFVSHYHNIKNDAKKNNGDGEETGISLLLCYGGIELFGLNEIDNNMSNRDFLNFDLNIRKNIYSINIFDKLCFLQSNNISVCLPFLNENFIDYYLYTNITNTFNNTNTVNIPNFFNSYLSREFINQKLLLL